jgi:hypothetical protein
MSSGSIFTVDKNWKKIDTPFFDNYNVFPPGSLAFIMHRQSKEWTGNTGKFRILLMMFDLYLLEPWQPYPTSGWWLHLKYLPVSATKYSPGFISETSLLHLKLLNPCSKNISLHYAIAIYLYLLMPLDTCYSATGTHMGSTGRNIPWNDEMKIYSGTWNLQERQICLMCNATGMFTFQSSSLSKYYLRVILILQCMQVDRHVDKRAKVPKIGIHNVYNFSYFKL